MSCEERRNAQEKDKISGNDAEELLLVEKMGFEILSIGKGQK